MLAQAVKVRWSTMGFTENDANVAMGTVPRGTLPTIESMREDSSALPAPVPVPRPSADEFTLPGAPSAESQAVPRKLQCHHCLEQIWMPPSAHVVACPYCFTCNAVPESPDVAASSARSTDNHWPSDERRRSHCMLQSEVSRNRPGRLTRQTCQTERQTCKLPTSTRQRLREGGTEAGARQTGRQSDGKVALSGQRAVQYSDDASTDGDCDAR